MNRDAAIHPRGGRGRVYPKLAACLLACALSGVPLAAAARGGAPSAPSLFGEQVDVRVVNLEAVVTDRSGARVTGLGPGDLRLEVDGKAVPIDYFTEVRDGKAVASGGGQTLPGAASLAAGDAVGTSYLLFVDDYFSLRVRRDEVLYALKKDLAVLGPEDRMAIVAYDGRKLDLLSGWSQDRAALGQAIDAALARHSKGLERRADVRAYGAGPQAGGGTVRAFTNPLTDHVIDELAAVSSAMRAFSDAPGRKAMLLLSTVWPYAGGEYQVDFSGRPILSPDVLAGTGLMQGIVDTANRTGYTLFPVDVSGASGRLRRGITDLRATLFYTAEQTGGRAMVAGLRTEALKDAQADTRSYYWLAFTPSWKGTDKRHRIEITAMRPGLKVRSRGDFLDLSRQSEVSYRVESAAFFGEKIDSGTGGAGLLVELGKPTKTKRHEMAVPLTLAIPVRAVTPVKTADGYVTELEVRVAARDVNGDRSEVSVIPVRFTTTEEPTADHFYKYETTLALRSVEQRLVLAVYDPLGNRITAADSDVQSP